MKTQILLERAAKAEKSGRIPEAFLLYASVWSSFPANAKARAGVERLRSAVRERPLPLNAPPERVRALLQDGNDVGPPAAAEAAKLLEDHPFCAIAHNILGVVASRSKHYALAIGHFERALEIEPLFIDARNNLGAALRATYKIGEAVLQFRFVLAIDPNFGVAHSNLAACFRDTRDGEAARRHFLAAMEAAPDSDEYELSYADFLARSGSRSDALSIQKRVFQRSPNAASYSDYLHNSTHLCEFDCTRDLERWIDTFDRHRPGLDPFVMLAIDGDPVRQLKRAAAVSATYPHTAPASPHVVRSRIRIGYFSADFHDHATMRLFAETLERHDRERFEVIAYSFGPDLQDAYRKRAVSAVDRFVDASAMSDEDLAARARGDELDIAVDLKGFTKDHRFAVFAARLAPVQISYLGFPATTGAPFMDYVIGDPVVTPLEHAAHFSEKLILLPDCYQPTASFTPIGADGSTRGDHGLPADGVVFCSFNQTYKISPSALAAWIRILEGVPSSVMWILCDERTAAANLKREAERCGVDPDRLVIAGRTDHAGHLRRLMHADLMLDTFPYNAHTTANDALRAGLPILTVMGRTFAGRVAASILTAAGLPELATESVDAYVDHAIRWGNDSDARSALRRRVSEKVGHSPLFDNRRYTQKIESAYSAAHRRHRSGSPPDHIVIAA